MRQWKDAGARHARARPPIVAPNAHTNDPTDGPIAHIIRRHATIAV